MSMNFRKFCFLSLLFFSCSSSPYSYRLAICAMFKNEAPWLKEWLAYHHKVLGVEHFYLYNNDSTDDYKDILGPFIDEGIVDLIDWSSADPGHALEGPFMDGPWIPMQIGAYNDCLKKRALGKAKWVAMIDIDEFIVPVKGVESFYALLHQAEKNKKGTVALQWRVFGTSGVQNLVEGEFLTEKLTWRSKDDHPWNQLVKSIHRPEAVAFCIVHTADKLNPNFGAKTLKADEARIHHYWARTEEFCSERRKDWKKLDPRFLEAFHKIEDPTILQYLPVLKSQFSQFR